MKKIYLLLGLAALIMVVGIISRLLSITKIYKTEVIKELKSESFERDTLTQADIDFLPQPIQKYLNYVGVIGKEKIHNVRVSFVGDFKLDIKQNWMKCKAEQYDFFENFNRMFYIKVNMFGVPVEGRDLYYKGKGNMLIRLASLITIANDKGPEMDIAEMVTLFNDMCLFAPASLIDKRIQWQTIDSLTVKGIFEKNGQKVSAVLFFNEKGELINFTTNDRYYISGKNYKKVEWSTPVKNYSKFAGIKVPVEAEAIWHFTEGDFCYAKFKLKEIEYNCKKFK
jgi:hypothetical protein